MICTLHIVRQELVRSCTCVGVVPSIVTINCPLILGEYVEPVVKLLSVVNSVVLHVKNRNVTACTEERTEV